MNIKAIVFLLLFANASAQDGNCDFYQNVQIGLTYNVNSPQYPNYYTPGVTCRWIASCPAGYNCRLDCSEINLPQSPQCNLDRLLISKNGDAQLAGAETYCGRGTLTAVSAEQMLSVGLITSTASPGGRFTCLLYAQVSSTNPSTCNCGYNKVNRIVGGEETGVNEFPSMVGIVDVTIYEIKCGGVIIDKSYVLTAAHCLYNRDVNNLAVVVGEHDINANESPATTGYRVASYVVHPLYSQETYDYDIGIITVASNIAFNELVGPICLPFKFVNTDFTGKYVTFLGWGTIFAGGPPSNVLQKVDVQVISNNVCQYQTPFLSYRQICTLSPGKDACQDDSGGPALYMDNTTGLLFNLGIISNGALCASGSPGVNTRVTALLDWITTVAPANYCKK